MVRATMVFLLTAQSADSFSKHAQNHTAARYRMSSMPRPKDALDT